MIEKDFMHMRFWDTYTERIFLRGLTRTRGEGYMAACGLFLVFFLKEKDYGGIFSGDDKNFFWEMDEFLGRKSIWLLSAP